MISVAVNCRESCLPKGLLLLLLLLFPRVVDFSTVFYDFELLMCGDIEDRLRKSRSGQLKWGILEVAV